MFAIFHLLLKNFRILARSKAATTALFFGPIILVLLLGTAFNTAQLHGLKLATYSSEYNNLTDSIISKLSTQFEIVKAASNESCIEGIKSNEWHVCFIFPENFSIEGNNKIDFYVNPAHINLVHSVTNLISAKVEERTEELRISLIEGIMDKADTIEDDLAESKEKVASIKNSVKDMSNSLQTAQQDLSKINLSISLSDFNISELESVLTTIKTENQKIISETKSIEDTVIKEAIESYTTEITNNLNNATNITNGLETTASLAVSKLGTASQTTEQTRQKISSALTELNEMSGQLDTVESNLASIEDQTKKIKALSASQIAQPITASIKEVLPEKKYIELIMPLLVALMLFFGGIFLGSNMVMSEKRSKAYFRNFILPVNKSQFVISTYLTAVIIMIFQVIVLFAILSFVLTPPFSLPMLLVVFLASSVFILVGMCIGYVSRTAETSVLITIAAILFMLFFSNLVLPVETIASLRQLAVYNPLTISNEMIKSISLLGLGLGFFTKILAILAGYIAVFLSLALLLQESTKRHI